VGLKGGKGHERPAGGRGILDTPQAVARKERRDYILSRVNAKQLTAFTRQFATLLDAGLRSCAAWTSCTIN